MRKETFIRWSIFWAFVLAAFGQNAFGGALLTVNSPAISNVCDDKLSLGEAAQLARGGGNMRSITDGEKAQISGASWVLAISPPPCAAFGWVPVNGIGASFADDIVFTNDVGTLFGLTILGKNDDVDGLKPNGGRVVLDGMGLVAPNFGITIETESGSQVRNLVIQNFPTAGIFAQALNGAKFEGLEIRNNAGAGISIGFAGGTTNKNSRNVTIGGDQPQHRNKIYANGGDGIFISASPSFDRFPDEGIFIMNNLIGTSDGVTDNGNAGNGISLSNAFGVIIGDLNGLTRNIISGNNNDGITLDGAGAISNLIVGNFIGTTESSGAPLGNGASGVALLNAAGSMTDFISSGPNKIGMPGLGNVISANGFGVFIGDSNTSKNLVQGNLIGTNVGGNTDLGNALDGVLVGAGTFDNTIGGTGANEGNLIAFNRNGIYSDGGIRNGFRRNRIFSNDNLGIELTPVGVTPNDPGDGDSGPNNLQNYPVITFVRSLSASVAIEGTFNSAPNQTFTLEFFGNSSADASGFGEGRNFLGTAQVTTNGTGNATFSLNFGVTSATTSNWVSATATDSVNNTSEFSAARNICADMRFSPTSILAPVGGISSNFVYLNSTGCAAPTATGNTAWVTVNSVLGGQVNYTVAANTGPPRDALINVLYNNGTGQSTASFQVSQNNGCAYSINPSTQNFTGPGGGGSTNVTPTNSACGWSSVSNAPSWITITGGVSGTGNGTVSFTVAPNNTGVQRIGTINAAGQTLTINQSAVFGRAPFDFDGDARTDISIFRPSNGQWWLNRSTAGTIVYTFGNSSDRLTPGDFTGDGKTDVAIFRPSTGEWFVLRSENSTFYSFPFGVNGDVPVPGDYDGDGKTDAAVFRPGNSTWYVQRSTGGTTNVQFGSSGDRPVASDYDGDGKTDIAIFRPASGQWWLNRSTLGVIAVTFGASTDKQVPGDYTGDGKSDVALWRPSTGAWFVLRSENFTYYSSQFGANGDVPVPGDYDGDGRFDTAVFRPSNSTWYLQRSTAGVLIQAFGAASDTAVPAAFVP